MTLLYGEFTVHSFFFAQMATHHTGIPGQFLREFILTRTADGQFSPFQASRKRPCKRRRSRLTGRDGGGRGRSYVFYLALRPSLAAPSARGPCRRPPSLRRPEMRNETFSVSLPRKGPLKPPSPEPAVGGNIERKLGVRRLSKESSSNSELRK